MSTGVNTIFENATTAVTAYLSWDVGTIITFVVWIVLLLLLVRIVFRVVWALRG